MRRTAWLIGLAVLLIGASASAKGIKIEGDWFPGHVKIGKYKLKLRGVGLREKWVFNVYTMGLYLKNHAESAAEIINSNQPKFIWLQMQRSISKEKMDDAVDEGLKKNLSAAQYAKVKDRFETFKSCFPVEIKKKLQMGFTYLPNRTYIYIGGKKKAVIKGKAFMTALFKIWFGGKPADSDLKKRVLSGK